jgi:hypothetical protein
MLACVREAHTRRWGVLCFGMCVHLCVCASVRVSVCVRAREAHHGAEVAEDEGGAAAGQEEAHGDQVPHLRPQTYTSTHPPPPNPPIPHNRTRTRTPPPPPATHTTVPYPSAPNSAR